MPATTSKSIPIVPQMQKEVKCELEKIPHPCVVFLSLLSSKPQFNLTNNCDESKLKIKLKCSAYTAIIRRNVEISLEAPNPNITHLFLNDNKDVYFLPIQVHEKMPKLERYWAASCSVLSISKKNFEKLHELKWLDLKDNFITSIPSNTFEDLKNVREIYLGEFRNDHW